MAGDVRSWKQKRIHFVHEQNSGVALVNGNLNLIKRYLESDKYTESERKELILDSIQRAKSGVSKIKDSQDYMYNQVKDLE